MEDSSTKKPAPGATAVKGYAASYFKILGCGSARRRSLAATACRSACNSPLFATLIFAAFVLAGLVLIVYVN